MNVTDITVDDIRNLIVAIRRMDPTAKSALLADIQRYRRHHYPKLASEDTVLEGCEWLANLDERLG